MDGLMMDYPLTITAMLRRTESMFGHKELVSRRADRALERSNYAQALGRARRLASALARLGVGRGDRVATLCWNHYQHHEAYLGIPCGGLVLHTLNLRLHPNDLAYIATHAGYSASISFSARFSLVFNSLRNQSISSARIPSAAIRSRISLVHFESRNPK